MDKPKWEAVPSPTANRNFFVRKRDWQKLGGETYDRIVFDQYTGRWGLTLNGILIGTFPTAEKAIKAEREL